MAGPSLQYEMAGEPSADARRKAQGDRLHMQQLAPLAGLPPRLSVSEHTFQTEERAPLVEAVKPAEGEGMARFEASEARKLPHMGIYGPVPLKKVRLGSVERGAHVKAGKTGQGASLFPILFPGHG